MHPTDRAYERLIEAFHPEVIPGYKQLTREVHKYDTRIFAQLNHNGQQCSGSLSRLPVWAPSPIPDVLYRETPKAMEIEDIREVIEYFARSAVHVREGGFDGVELQFGHSSLARQFMSRLTNFRGDEYGGSFENRMRFPLEVIAAVREGRWAPTSPWACGSAPTNSSRAVSTWRTPSRSPSCCRPPARWTTST